MTNSVEILSSLFLIIFAGFLCARYKILSEESSKYFNKFIFNVSVPVLVFASLASGDKAEINGYLPFIGINIIIVVLGYLITYFLFRFSDVNRKITGVLIYTANGGNVVYFGFPILLSLFGQTHFNLGVIYATVVLTVGDLVGFYLIGLNSGNSRNYSKMALEFINNPIVIASLLGFIALVVNLQMPQFINYSLDTIGRTTTGLALFSLGIYLYGKLGFDDLKFNVFSTFSKLILLPTIATIIVYFVFDFGGPVAQTSVIMAAMPTAVFSLIVSEAFGLDKKLTSNSIVLSSIMFLLTFNFWLWVINIL